VLLQARGLLKALRRRGAAGVATLFYFFKASLYKRGCYGRTCNCLGTDIYCYLSTAGLIEGLSTDIYWGSQTAFVENLSGLQTFNGLCRLSGRPFRP
jgi:hypothetical protein